MLEKQIDDKYPSARLNKAAWRIVALATALLSLCLVGAILAQDGLFSGHPGLPDHPDGLTTLALVLAILAFFVQIFVFVSQSQASASAILRSEELDQKTKEALARIEENNSATQKVLITNFNRLLDYVVGTAQKEDDSGADALEVIGSGEDAPGAGGETSDQSVNVAVVQEMINRSRVRERPQFEELQAGGASDEDQRIIEQMVRYPDQRDAENAVKVLSQLPVLSVAAMTRMATWEVQRRRGGATTTLTLRSGAPTPPEIQRLIEAGLCRRDGRGIGLTDLGRDIARVLPIARRRGKHPDWWSDVLKPLYEGD